MMDWSSPIEEEEIDWSSPLSSSKKPESLKEKVLRYGVKGPAASLGKFGNQLLNIPSNVAALVGPNNVSKALSYNPDFNYRQAVGLPAEQNLADIAIGLAPDVLGAFAVPAANLGRAGTTIGKIPKAGKYISKILAEGLPQAGYSALLSHPEDALENAGRTGAAMAPFSVASQLAQSTSPWARRGAQVLGGLLGYELGHEGTNALGFSPLYSQGAGLIGGALGARTFTSQKMLEDALTRGIDTTKVKERLDASRRLEMDYLTPAEAGLNPFLAQEQGSLGKTKEGAKHLFDKSQKRIESEGKAINKVLDTIYSEEKMSPQIKKLYEEAYPVKFPEEFSTKFENNEIIRRAKNKVENNTAFKENLKGVPKNSLAYWDHVKQALDDMIQVSSRKGNQKEAKILKESRNSLRDEMDLYSPEYTQARALVERKKVRDSLESVFNKKGERSGTNFYRALNDEKKFDELMHHLRNVPEAQEKLKDMRLIFKDLIGTPGIKGAAVLEKTSMNRSRSSTQDIMHMLENKLTQGKYDKQMIDFITSPNWDRMMLDINKISDKQKRMAKFLEIFGKTIGQTAKKEPFMETENYQIYD